MSALTQSHTILIDGIEVSLSFDISKEAYEHHLQDLEPCDRDSQALDLASSLGGVAVSQLHEVASKLALSFSVQACKFLELGEAHTALVNEAEPSGEVWQVNIGKEKAMLTRLENGKAVESYRPTDKASALKGIDSILQGLKPKPTELL
jgi:hypothetical protein